MAVIQPILASRGISAGSEPNIQIDNSVAAGLSDLGQGVAQIGAADQRIKLRQIEQQNQIAEFSATQGLQRLEDDNALKFATAQQQMPASGQGFAAGFNKTLIGQYDQFLNTVPANLRPKFAELIATQKGQWDNKAAAAEIDTRNAWYRNGVKENVDGSQTDVYNDPSQFGDVLDQTLRTIDATGLSQAEKDALKLAAHQTLSAAAADRALQDDPAALAKNLGVARPLPSGDAAAVIQSFEGFQATAKWDVNHYRLGYGSDTITRPDGTVVEVKPGMSVTQEDAARDLQRRVGEFQNTIVKQIGADEWAKLPEGARNGLTSVGYNYGSLPQSVVNAVKGGDPQAIAVAVQALPANPDRRAREAAIIRGDATAPASEPAPEFAGLTYADRLTYLDKALALQRQGETTQSQVANALAGQRKDQAGLDITQGNIVSDQQVLDLGLPPGDTNTLLGQLRTERDRVGQSQDYLSMIANGTAGALNPYDSDDRKLVDKAYDQIVKSAAASDRPAAVSNLIRESGIVPASVIASTRQQLSSPQIDQIGIGLQQAAALKTAVPQALSAQENGKEIADAAATYDELVNKQGLSLTEAAQKVADSRDPDKQKTAALLKDSFDQMVKDKKVGIGDLLGTFPDSNGILPGGQVSEGVTPALQLALEGDYMDTLRGAYNDANGNIDVAKSIAADRMKRFWGVTNVSGTPTLTRLPPERFYPPIDGSQDYIRALALKDAKSSAPDVANVLLLASPQTGQDVDAGQPPRYNLMYQMADGRWDTLPHLFQIGQPEIKTLSDLATQQRQVDFETRRRLSAYINSAMSPQVPAASPGASVPPTNGSAPKPPDFTDLQQQLTQIGNSRAKALGLPEPNVVPDISPDLLEKSLGAGGNGQGLRDYLMQASP